jgi:hypothetical protein
MSNAHTVTLIVDIVATVNQHKVPSERSAKPDYILCRILFYFKKGKINYSVTQSCLGNSVEFTLQKTSEV